MAEEAEGADADAEAEEMGGSQAEAVKSDKPMVSVMDKAWAIVVAGALSLNEPAELLRR